MKKLLITKAENVQVNPDSFSMGKTVLAEGGDSMTVSDGYHTMDELYDHRIELWITVCRLVKKDIEKDHLKVYRSKVHADGSSYDGWFMLGILDMITGKQMTYHLPEKRWEDTSFAYTCETKEAVPEFDGHTPADVIARMKTL